MATPERPSRWKDAAYEAHEVLEPLREGPWRRTLAGPLQVQGGGQVADPLQEPRGDVVEGREQEGDPASQAARGGG